jgi:hypothetical protein
MTLLISVLCLLFLGQVSSAQSDEDLHLVSPIGAVARSAILPGWGQFYAHSRFQGTSSMIGTSGLLIGALIAHQSFQDVYNNAYVPIALNAPDSPEAAFQYNRANQRFKLRQFFLFAVVGVWAYSVIDSYVGANLYNATTKANQLIDDAKRIEKLSVQLEVTPTQLHLGIVKFF